MDEAGRVKMHTLTAGQAASLRGAIRELMEAAEVRDTVIGEILDALSYTRDHQIEIVNAAKGVIRVHAPQLKAEVEEAK